MEVGSCGTCAYKHHKYPSCLCKYTIHDKNRVYIGRDYAHNLGICSFKYKNASATLAFERFLTQYPRI